MALRHRFTFSKGQIPLLGAALLAIVAVALSALAAVLQLRSEVTEHANGATQNLAVSLTQTFDGLFDMIDVALLASVDEIERQLATGKPDGAAIGRTLERQAQRIPHVAYLRATDARGNIVYGTGLPSSAVNLGDRDFFQRIAQGRQLGVVLAKPMVGRISGKPLITLARRIQTAKGDFAGVVYASIFIEELERLLAQIPMDQGGSLALRDADLGLIARQVAGERNQIAMGDAQLSGPFMAMYQQSPMGGTYVSEATEQDPVVRTYTYRSSEKYGFLVHVGTRQDAQWREWKTQAWAVLVLVLLFDAALLLLVGKINSARRRSEEMLRSLSDAEAQHRELLGSLNTGVVVHAPDTHIIFSNARACQLLGLSEAQMQGKTAIDPAWCFVDESGQPLAPAQYPVSRVLATGEAIDELVVGVKVPGRNWLLWLQGSAFPAYDAGGTLLHVVVNFHDITKRREAEERWRFALEGAGDGVWDLEVETGVAVYSRRYLEMLGYAENEVPGLHSEWLKRVHPDDIERVQNEIRGQMRQSSGAVASEYRLQCKDGSYKWIQARGMVVSRGVHGQALRIVGTHTDISEKKAAEATIWHQANFDPLTQLPNRRLFYDRLEMKMRQAQRESSALALLFIDLDQFKEVNDTLGHDVGDQLLVEAATRLKHVVRDYDTVARLGGDEFTVTLAGHQHAADVGAIAQKIIDRLSEPFVLSGNETYVSASIGIALFPDDAVSLNELVKNADQAMYAAKAVGRKCFRYFTKGMQDSAIARMLLVADLRHAVAENQFEVHYQPIVSLSDGKVHKAEALMRWRHPERGWVPPSQFIPVAEDIGVIHEIGDWMFAQAVSQLAVWKARYGSNFQLSVNKSPLQFVGAGHSRWLKQLEDLQVDGSSIVIEITEGVLMDSNAAVAHSLFQFRDFGIQVAIDDFGTGYSSLSYLKKFDIDYLKIDQSFVRNLSPESADFALCEAIIVMAHKLGLKVIAEGVETQAQRALLQQVACDYAQGYLFARPMPVADFDAFMAASGHLPP